jgi:predicted acylesterase/phospholipase RssA
MTAIDENQAVILSGGGAYGAYEVGVMKALLGGEVAGSGYRPVEPGVFTGTSVGSFNASIMVSRPGEPSGRTADLLEGLWLEEIADNAQRCGNGVFRFRGNVLRLFDPTCYANPVSPFERLGGDIDFYTRSLFRRGLSALMGRGSLANRALQVVDISALISVDPFREMLRRTIRSDAIRYSDRKLRVVATNWETGEVKTFENDDVADEEFGPQMIMASAAIPGIFPPVRIGEHVYVDGGAVMNTPLKCALQAGATTMHVVYLDPDVSNIPLSRLMNSVDTFDRLYTIMLATKMNEDIDTAAWINEGLTTLEKAARGGVEQLGSEEITAFIRVAAQIETRLRAGRQYNKLTIHRYHPKGDLGGPLGMLNFGQDAITRLIARGFEDAVYHSCAESHCIFPDTPPPPPKTDSSRPAEWVNTTNREGNRYADR